MKAKVLLLIAAALTLPCMAFAQLTQTIRGTVSDAASGQPLVGVTVVLGNTSTAAVTAVDGSFALTKVPVGRHTVQATFLGYEPAMLSELLVGSAHETSVEIKLVEKPQQIDEVVVRPRIDKTEPVNTMTTLGSQMFSVEEAGRFAGGMDDPARLVSSFAGVTSTAANNNGISIHGNSPAMLQWRIEGVEVPSANHFSDVQVFGGGFMSGLSSNVLGNSDFFVGAFPAEYGNAVSGVFDMKLRNGSTTKYQHAFQVGLLGIDLASEGPISRKSKASYIFNYRYSMLGLISLFMKEMRQNLLSYQDLNLKVNIPTKRAGTFSLWAVGLVDRNTPSDDKDDYAKFKYPDDNILGRALQSSGAAGLSHKYRFGNGRTSLNTTFAATLLNNHISEKYVKDADFNSSPYSDFKSSTTNYIFTTALNHKFSARHTNKTGVTITNILFDTHFDKSPMFNEPLQRYVDTKSHTHLVSAYSSSQINLGRRWTLNAGVAGQYLTLSKKVAIEPRVGLKWRATERSSFAVAYGLHSRMEKIDAYFVKGADGSLPNKNLGFTSSHHVMAAWNYRMAENMNLKVEAYCQYLFNVPVEPNGTFSILNRNNFYVTEKLEGKGAGVNAGIDVTIEKYLTDGYYWRATGSIYESKYRGGNGVWHDTKYNRRFAVNALAGKEWMIRGKNVLSVNGKVTVLGGHRYTPVDEAATIANPDKEVQFDQSKMYSRQFNPQLIGDISISYRINRRRVAHEIAFTTVNLTKAKDYQGHKYNLGTGKIDAVMQGKFIGNLSWRLEF